MGFFEKIDLAILDGFYQKIADNVQERWGYSCFRLAIWCDWVFLILTTYIYLSGIVFFGWTWAGSLGLLLIAIAKLYSIRINQKDEKKWEELAIEGLMNDNRISIESIAMRLALAIGTILVAIIFPGGCLVYNSSWNVFVMSLVGTTVVGAAASEAYFSACTPKPPSPLKAGNELAAAVVSTR